MPPAQTAHPSPPKAPHITTLVKALLVTWICCLVPLLFSPTPCRAQTPPLDFSDLSLEELMNFEVVTANRQAQSVADTAAAIFVISNEDIQQSGVTTIADALRMAPGVQVAKSGSHTWAVSIRGFNDRFSNKLLVLMDGRTLYNPLHSGVTWEVQDMILEDIDRIEIIRGPGAAMWGANAVNGVINIISRNSADTTGTLVTVATGNVEQASGQVRYGGTIGKQSSYRIYGKYKETEGGRNRSSSSGEDNWNHGQGGFRVDHAPSPTMQLSFQGDVYKSRLAAMDTIASLPIPIGRDTQHTWDMKGYHLLGKLHKSLSENSHLQAILYYDSTALDSAYGEEDRDTLDFDFQHIFPLGERQHITWGLSFRQSTDRMGGSYQIGPLNDSTRSDQLYSAFLQDEFSLFHPSLTFTLGSKFEHNNYTGFEIQPSIRGNWRQSETISLWTAISRAVRTPSRFEHDGLIRTPLYSDNNTGAIVAGHYQSDEDFQSESLIAYEAGYRQVFSDKLSYDLALFYNDYHDLKTQEPLTPITVASPLGDVTILPFTMDNKLSGYSWGGELVLNYIPIEWWRLQAVYSELRLHLQNDTDSLANNAQRTEETSPSSQFSLRSTMQLPGDTTLHLWLRYVDTLENEATKAYWEGDIRMAWHPLKELEVSLVGLNLFNESHKEIEQASYLSLNTEVRRSYYLKLSWSY